jgi:hypothetical protein
MSSKTTTICDFCGNELKEREHRYRVDIRDINSDGHARSSWSYDSCVQCYDRKFRKPNETPTPNIRRPDGD